MHDGSYIFDNILFLVLDRSLSSITDVEKIINTNGHFNAILIKQVSRTHMCNQTVGLKIV